MKPVHNYCVIVDSHRAGYAVHRHTAGRYRVGAHDAKQAEQLVKEAIGFGDAVTRMQHPDDDPNNVPYKTVVKEIYTGDDKRRSWIQVNPSRANAPQELEEYTCTKKSKP